MIGVKQLHYSLRETVTLGKLTTRSLSTGTSISGNYTMEPAKGSVGL